MNVKLLEQVRKAILEEPLAFDMNNFANETTDSPCGSTQCIGGTAAFFSNPIKFRKIMLDGREEGPDMDVIENMARVALDLTDSEARRLFFTGDQVDGDDVWPKQFTKRFRHCTTEIGRARVAAARIEHFIKTKGRE